jgi:hypothetical protein
MMKVMDDKKEVQSCRKQASLGNTVLQQNDIEQSRLKLPQKDDWLNDKAHKSTLGYRYVKKLH